MAKTYTIYKICPQCNGDKTIQTTRITEEEGDVEKEVIEIECPMCSGEGEIVWGRSV